MSFGRRATLPMAIAAAVSIACGVTQIVEVEVYSWETGRNGLDLESPAVQHLDQLQDLRVDLAATGMSWIDPQTNASFVDWYGTHDGEAERVMGYLVQCAFAAGVTVVHDYTTWTGAYGLATKNPSKPFSDPDDRKWVSACLIAHANQKHSVQPIWLRREGVAAPKGAAFTMGYPEGVFYGDLFTNPAAKERWAMSLNLPDVYDPAAAKWWPPNAVLGRRTDFDGGGVVQFHGKCLASGGSPPVANAQRFGDPAAHVFDQKEVCPGGAHAGCASLFHPITVYAPWLVNVEDATPWAAGAPPAGDASRRLEAFARGGPADLKCDPDDVDPNKNPGKHNRKRACVGDYESPPAAPPVCGSAPSRANGSASNPRTVRLKNSNNNREELRAVLRAVSAPDEAAAGAEKDPFTAMIRFKTDDKGHDPGAGEGPKLMKRDAAGQWVDIAAPVKWSTRRNDDGFAWLEVYPVYLLKDDTTAAGRLSLAIGLVGQGPGSAAKKVEIDAVGFVPGLPWCCARSVPDPWCAIPDATGTIAGVCQRKIDDERKHRAARAPVTGGQ